MIKTFTEKSNRFRIELKFEDLKPEEAKNFIEWLGWTGTGEEAKPFLKLNYDVKRQADKIIPTDVKAGVDEEGYLLSAETKDYFKANYLKPLRDAENELVAKRNSRLSQILLGDEAFKGKEKNNDLVKIFSGLKEELENYFKGVDNAGQPKATEGKQIKDKIDSYIKSFYSENNESEFKSTSTDIKSILEKLTFDSERRTKSRLRNFKSFIYGCGIASLNQIKLDWFAFGLGGRVGSAFAPASTNASN